MPTLEQCSLNGKPYLRIAVNAGETFPGGKSLPYPTWIGTIHPDGKCNVWTPAASVFRGYKGAATSWVRSLAADPDVLALLES